MLDGKEFNALSTGSFTIVSDDLSGDQVAFRALFDDGSRGIFLATLVPELAGDYNHDDVVNAADYTVWRDHFGEVVEPCSNGDGNCNGFVGNLDYPIWKENFGRTLDSITNAIGGGLSDPATSIPEPSSLVLAALAVVGVLGRGFNHGPPSR